MSAIKFRFKAFSLHLFASILTALIVGCLVIFIWFPQPYSNMAGGLNLLLLIACIDVVLGPVLTLIVFDQRKQQSELMRDLLIIIFVQLAGLFYGLHTLYLARPVALVFEESRFRVVTAAGVVSEELSLAPSGLGDLSLLGPRIIGTRGFKNQGEKYDAANKAFSGVDIGARPSFWQEYSLSVNDALKNSRPLSLICQKYPNDFKRIEDAVIKTGLSKENIKFVPIVSKEGNWVALINGQTAKVIGFLEEDGFF